jgi:glucose dehydrogenase
MAYNAETGEKLWEVALNGENVAPVTYMLHGKQYVSVLAGATPTAFSLHLFWTVRSRSLR